MARVLVKRRNAVMAHPGGALDRAVDRPSAPLRSVERERPFLRERALHLTGQRLAEGWLMGKEQGWLPDLECLTLWS